MLNMSKIIVSRITLTAKIGAHLAERFPKLLEYMVKNSNIEEEAFANCQPDKNPVRTAENILGTNNPDVISRWCKTKDKRARTVNVVLSSWKLPESDQLSFVKKSLADHAASFVLQNDEFVDSAKLLVCRRAKPSAVWKWLASDPLIEDQDWLDLVFGITGHSGVLPYAALHQRPHLAQNLIESDLEDQIAVACAFADYIDPDMALQKVAGLSGPAQISAISNLADHPSLPESTRVEVYKLARQVGPGLEKMLYQQGSIMPGSFLATKEPLALVKDPRVVEAISLRQTDASVPGRAFQVIELTKSPAAAKSLQLAHRLQALHSSHFGYSIAAGKALQNFGLRLKENGIKAPQDDYFLWNYMSNLLEAHERRAAALEEVSALKSPVRTSKPSRYNYIYSFQRQNSYDSYMWSIEKVLDCSLEDIVRHSGYSSTGEFSKHLSDILVQKLGTGEDEASLKRWETFFSMVDKTDRNLTLSKVLKSSIHLSK